MKRLWLILGLLAVTAPLNAQLGGVPNVVTEVTELTETQASVLSRVSAEHNFTISVDIEQALASDVVKSLEAQFGGAKIQTVVDQMKQFINLDLRKDLKSLVVSGVMGRDETNCIYLRGNFDIPRLVDMVRFNDQYSETNHNDALVYSWYDKGEAKQKWGTFLTDELLVICEQDQAIKGAVDAYRDPAKARSTKVDVKAVASRLKSQPVAWALLSKSENSPPDIANNPILNKIGSVMLTLDLEPTMTLKGVADFSATDVAQDFHDMAKGVIALGKMIDDKPELKLLAGKTTVERQQKELILALSMAQEQAVPLLIKVIRKNRGQQKP